MMTTGGEGMGGGCSVVFQNPLGARQRVVIVKASEEGTRKRTTGSGMREPRGSTS